MATMATSAAIGMTTMTMPHGEVRSQAKSRGVKWLSRNRFCVGATGRSEHRLLRVWFGMAPRPASVGTGASRYPAGGSLRCGLLVSSGIGPRPLRRLTVERVLGRITHPPLVRDPAKRREAVSRAIISGLEPWPLPSGNRSSFAESVSVALIGSHRHDPVLIHLRPRNRRSTDPSCAPEHPARTRA